MLDTLAALGFSRIESYWLFYLTISWLLAWGGYSVYRLAYPDRPRWTWERIVGVAFVLFPFVGFAHDIVESFQEVLQRGTVARTVPAWVWWRAIRRRTWEYILIPLFGLFLAHGHAHWRIAPLHIRLRNTLDRVSAWPQRGWTRDIVNGFGLFVIISIGYVMLNIFLSQFRQLDTGDDSAVFRDITPALALGLAVIAGVSEEFLFRGIMQNALRRVMPVGIAVVLQAIGFGLIHSGYGALSHVIGPAIFGLVMGLITLRLGLWPAILVHFLLDLALFLLEVWRGGITWAGLLVPWLFVAGIALPVAYYGWEWYLRRTRGPPAE